MSLIEVGYIAIVAMFALILIGIPIGWAMAIVGVFGELYVTGFAAPASLANGKVILTARVNGEEVGWTEITGPGRPYTFEFDIPAKFLNAYAIEVALECDKTFRPPGDSRELGTIIQKIEVRAP